MTLFLRGSCSQSLVKLPAGKQKTGGTPLHSLCSILLTTVTLHLLTFSPDNLNIMQSEIQQHKKYGHKENPLWHTYTLWAIKTAIVTLATAKSVLLKGQGSRYNNEPSGPGSSSPPETQTLHHLQPGVYKGEESGEGRDYLDLKHALAMQMSEICHANEAWTEIKGVRETTRLVSRRPKKDATEGRL